jgi:aryl-alcohol dehydrogenase-like predicted oxidoreductase
MKYVESKGFNVSAFSLGTVQLGMNYGLGEYTQKPEKSYAFELLDKAVELGVNVLDTADNYGDSESVIGEWLLTKKKEDRPFIVTKFGHPLDWSSEENLKKNIIEHADASLKKLNLDKIDLLMAHSTDEYLKNPKVFTDALFTIKEQGKTTLTGISAYSRHDYKMLAKTGFDAVQIPINVFDWERIEDGGIEALAESGMTVYARSVFLQGLVFMKPEELDEGMSFCKKPLQRFLDICREWKMSPAVLAMSFVLSLPGITSVVLGCQRVEQVENNCELISQVKKLNVEELNLLRKEFSNIDPRVINPSTWSNNAWKKEKK